MAAAAAAVTTGESSRHVPNPIRAPNASRTRPTHRFRATANRCALEGRRNPARDPRFPITADPALPHTLPSIQQQAGLRAPSPAQPPRRRPRQGPRRLRQPRRPGRRCVAQTISDRRVPFFQLASHPQPNKHPVPFPTAWCHPCRPRHRAIPAPIAPGRARRRSSDGSTIRFPGTRAHARVAAGVTRAFPRVALIGNPKLREEHGVSVFVWL